MKRICFSSHPCEIHIEFQQGGVKYHIENFEIYSSQWAKNALKLSTIVGEMF